MISVSPFRSILVALFLPVAAHAVSDQGIIGWDGDKNAGLALMNGSIGIRGRPELNLQGPELRWNIRGVGHAIARDLPEGTRIEWSNAEGYLPALVTRFEKDGYTITITNFADKITIGEKDFVAAYSRVIIHNHSGTAKTIDPGPSPQFVVLRQDNRVIADKSTATHDFAIVIDRFGKEYPWPDDDSLKKYQPLDQAYRHMRDYWNEKLGRLFKIKHLPDPRLIDQFQADYCYMQIVKDGVSQNAGEFGYDEPFSHDLVSQLNYLFLMGEFESAREKLNTLYNSGERGKTYLDATYKYSWPFALYLKLTDDMEFVRQKFDTIKRTMRIIESHRTGPGKIMDQTWALDNFGYWTLDNFAALQGLGCYSYICRRLGEQDEQKWADDLYQSLLGSVDTKLHELSPVFISSRMDKAEAGGITFAFGCWPWDGYLWNLPQAGIPDRIDSNYDYLSKDGRFKSPFIWSEPWGGTPEHPAFFSTYSVGGASGMLRGTKWRGHGIKAFQFMMKNAQQGPLVYWECATMPAPSSWVGTHPYSGTGDCPDMFGPALAEKVLMESLIAERADGTLIIGRGIPEEWNAPGQRIEIADAPLVGRRKFGYSMTSSAGKIDISFTGDIPAGPIWIDLPIFQNQEVKPSTGTFDSTEDRIVLPAATRRVTIHIRRR